MKVLAANIVGLFVSVYLVLSHYQAESASSAFCELGSGVSCSTVLRSSWAVIFGVPVAIHGVAYFFLACSSAFMCLLATEFRAKKDAIVVNFYINVVGLLSVFYFITAEYLIGALCPLCTVVHIVICFSFVLSFMEYRASGWTLTVTSATDIIIGRINFLLVALAVVLLPVIVFNLPIIHPSYAPQKLEALTTCLAEKGAKMYGSKSCSHCVSQKAMLGKSFSKIEFVECSHGSGELQCREAGIKGYPTWQLADGKRHEGTMAIKELAEFADCTLSLGKK